MFNMKKVLLVFVAVSLLSFTKLSAFAEEIGYIDINKIIANYSKARNVEVNLKAKEADIKKFINDARKNIKTSSNVVESRKLQAKYTRELQEKSTLYKKEQLAQISSVEESITSAVKIVAERKKITAVFKKEDLIIGGTDLTSDVIVELNKK